MLVSVRSKYIKSVGRKRLVIKHHIAIFYLIISVRGIELHIAAHSIPKCRIRVQFNYSTKETVNGELRAIPARDVICGGTRYQETGNQTCQKKKYGSCHLIL